MSQPIFNFKPPQLDTAYEFLKHYSSTAGDSEAIVFQQQRFNYRQLKQAVDQIAKAMIKAGVQKGDRVACLSAPHPECFQVLLASMAVGAIWVGINPRYQIAEMEHVIQDSQASLFFSRSKIGKRDYQEEISQLQQLRPGMQTVIINQDPVADGSQSLEDFLSGATCLDDAQLLLRQQTINKEDPCLIVYTSGTTGKPKGALLKQSACVRHGKLSLAQFKPEPLKVINYYPVNHVAGIVANSLYTLVGGGCNYLMEQFNPQQAMALIEAESITQWGGIPTMLQLCVGHEDYKNRDLSSVQFINWGGSAAPADLVKTLSDRFPYLSTLYAATEITGGAFIIPPGKNLPLLANSVGQALADVEYRLIKDDGSQAKAEEPGELQLKGSFLMLEYWNNPQATEQTIDRDGWLKTGDIGKLDQEGNLFLIGRSKEMYKSGGFNVYPREIEQALEKIDGVDMVAVVSVSDDLYGEVGHAFLSSNKPLNEQGLKDSCRQLLANYKIPKTFHILADLPLLPNGKINKKHLQQIAQKIADETPA